MTTPSPAEVLALFRSGKDTLEIAMHLGLFRDAKSNKGVRDDAFRFQVPDELRVVAMLEDAREQERFAKWQSAQVAVPA